MKLLIIIPIFLLFQSCSQGQEIVITKDYIDNGYWDEYNRSLLIEKMKIKKDSILDIFDPNFKKEVPNHWNITNKLVVDSTFVYRNSLLDQKKINFSRRIYFNQRNANDWNFGHYSIDKQFPTIGSLERNTWYKFSKLKTRPFYIYIYIDGAGEIHRFNVDMSNY